VRAPLIVVALVLPLALVGCGGGPTDSRASSLATADAPSQPATHESSRWGYSVEIPAGWHRAERSLSNLTDPVEILVAATYEPRVGGQDCGPLEFGGFDARQVLVTVLERGLDPGSEWTDFPPRPAHFEFESGMTSEFADCVRDRQDIPLRDHWFRFTDAGRHFHVLVVIGADAPHEAADAAYRMLDSLRFDPAVKPDWRAAG